MIEKKQDLWSFTKLNEFICITTNGFVKKNGDAVMDRGCAFEATQKFPGVEKLLGDYIKKNGNKAGVLRVDHDETCLIVFPVKHNWWEKADLKLIKQSAKWLSLEAIRNPDNKYILPRPGCGNGQLDWKDVKKIIEFLPDNVIVVSK